MKKSKFEVEGYEILERVVKRESKRVSSGRIYLPKAWVEKKVIVIRSE